MRKLFKAYNNVLQDKSSYGCEISLFFVSDLARGKGIGKGLMGRFIEYCRENDIQNIILMTDASCNFGFYDHCGFTRVNEVYSEFFGESKDEYNGFAYAYSVKS